MVASGHAGLKPEFQALEDEIRHVLARVDDPRAVMHYLRELRVASKMWLSIHEARKLEK